MKTYKYDNRKFSNIESAIKVMIEDNETIDQTPTAKEITNIDGLAPHQYDVIEIVEDFKTVDKIYFSLTY